MGGSRENVVKKESREWSDGRVGGLLARDNVECRRLHASFRVPAGRRQVTRCSGT